jgi:hypothetical protein
MFLTILQFAIALLLFAYGYFLLVEFGVHRLFAWLLSLSVTLLIVILTLNKLYA